MLPVNLGNHSTSFSQSPIQKAAKSNLERLSKSNSGKTTDEILFETLMSDPKKKEFLLKMLSQEKENIAKYKQQGGGNLTKTPMRHCKRTYCESPTALLRRRALEKNRDSDSSSTRSLSPTISTPVEFDKLLKGVIAYVEIRSKDADRSAGAKMLMESMGAVITDTLTRKVTHVVFKDGSFNTYQKAKLLKVHLVSVLWLEAIRKYNTRVPEKNYPALGTETYDVNVTAIYQDYENIVQDEHRRSLAVVSQRNTMQSQKRSRLTALPSELNSSAQNKSKFPFNGRLSDVIPSSQEFDVESMMSFRSDRPGSARLVNESDEEIVEMTSDDDSECGVINGHSFNHLKDSAISDTHFNHGQETRVSDQSMSSTSSVSLLKRKSFTKTNNQLLDMDLTENVPENFVKQKSLGETSRKKLQSVKQSLFSQEIEGNYMQKDNNCNQRHTSKASISKLDSPCITISDMVLQPLQSSCNRSSSETMPNLRSSSDGTPLHGLNASNNVIPVHKSRTTKSSETMPSLRISSESTTAKNAIIGTSLDKLNKQSNNTDADSLHKPRISSESISVRNEIRTTSSDKLNKQSDNTDIGTLRKVRTTKSSEPMPSLRISSDSTSVRNEIRTTSSDKLNNQSDNTNIGPLHKIRTTKSSETMPSLRISSDSTSAQSSIRRSSSDKLNKQSKNTGTSNSTSVQNIIRRTHSSDRLSKQSNTFLDKDCESKTHTTRRSENLSNLTISRDSTSRRSISISDKVSTHTEDKGLHKSRNTRSTQSFGIPSDGMKSKSLNRTHSLDKLNDVKNSTLHKKLEPKLPRNKQLRKLYNVNQAITNPAEFEKLAESQKLAVINTKKLIIPLPRLTLSEASLSNKKSKHKIVFGIKPKKKKFKNPSKKLKKVMKSVRNLFTSGESDDGKSVKQKNHVGNNTQKQKVNRKRDLVECDNARKLDDSEDKFESPPKRRCSLRIQNSQISSQIHNRRSTLDFVEINSIRSQRTQKLRAPKTSIVCTRMHKPDVQMFIQIVKKLGPYFVEDEVSRRTSHLVVGESKRTINLLRAICRGCWILKNEWLLRSLETGKWLPEEDYEVTDFSPAVQQCRRERQVFGNLFSMDIFSDCESIYVSRNSTPRRSDLEELIELCKGNVVKEIYRAKIIVGDWIRNENIICVNEKWILDSITFNKKKSFKKYLIAPTT